MLPFQFCEDRAVVVHRPFVVLVAVVASVAVGDLP